MGQGDEERERRGGQERREANHEQQRSAHCPAEHGQYGGDPAHRAFARAARNP